VALCRTQEGGKAVREVPPKSFCTRKSPAAGVFRTAWLNCPAKKISDHLPCSAMPSTDFCNITPTPLRSLSKRSCAEGGSVLAHKLGAVCRRGDTWLDHSLLPSDLLELNAQVHRISGLRPYRGDNGRAAGFQVAQVNLVRVPADEFAGVEHGCAGRL